MTAAPLAKRSRRTAAFVTVPFWSSVASLLEATGEQVRYGGAQGRTRGLWGAVVGAMTYVDAHRAGIGLLGSRSPGWSRLPVRAAGAALGLGASCVVRGVCWTVVLACSRGQPRWQQCVAEGTTPTALEPTLKPELPCRGAHPAGWSRDAACLGARPTAAATRRWHRSVVQACARAVDRPVSPPPHPLEVDAPHRSRRRCTSPAPGSRRPPASRCWRPARRCRTRTWRAPGGWGRRWP